LDLEPYIVDIDRIWVLRKIGLGLISIGLIGPLENYFPELNSFFQIKRNLGF